MDVCQGTVGSCMVLACISKFRNILHIIGFTRDGNIGDSTSYDYRVDKATDLSNSVSAPCQHQVHHCVQ